MLPRHVSGLNHDIDWKGIPKSVLTYPSAEPKKQISGLTNQYMPKPPSRENVTAVASTYGKGAMITVRPANKVVAH